MAFTEPKKPEAAPVQARCAVCGADCIDMQVNHATLCDAHFDGWLQWPRNPLEGGLVAMAAFVSDAKAKARGAA